MAKCDLCDKGITKRSPGLECGKCGKIVHGNQVCSGLSAKQLAALRNSDSLEWTCDECSRVTPNRKSSFIIPEDEEEDDDIQNIAVQESSGAIDVKKLLRDITSEVRKIIRKENVLFEETLNYFGKKLEDFGDKIDAFAGRIDDVEKKQTFLFNKSKHLETKITTLEVQIRRMEQTVLDKMVEISGIPKTANEDITLITKNVAKVLTVDDNDVIVVKRIEGKPGADGSLLVELKTEASAALWAQASKRETSPILAEHVVPNIKGEVAISKIMVRRALSKANKTLLWKAQQKLRPTFKYVWFQAGKVLARKEDKDKIIVIWCEEDLAHIKV